MNKEINYNRKVRKTLNKLFTKIKKELKNKKFSNDIYAYNVLISILKNSKIKEYNILLNLFYMTGYSDMYMDLNYKLKTNKISIEEQEIFNLLKMIDNCKDLEILFNSQSILIYAMDKIFKFNDLNGYDKIFIVKLLSDDDVKKINRINTLFFIDYKNYNIDVDIHFILNQMNKGIVAHSREQLLFDASQFIKKLILIDDKNIIKTLKRLVIFDAKLSNYLLKSDNDQSNDQILKMVERLNMFEKNNFNEYIKQIKLYQIMDLIDIYSKYKNFYFDKKEIIDEYTQKDTKFNNKIKKIRKENK